MRRFSETGPDEMLPMPRTKAKMQKMICGSAGSSPGLSIRDTLAQRDSRAMTEIILDHSAVKLRPSNPKVITKRMSSASVVPKPHKNKQDRAEPTQDTPSTYTSGRRSDRNPRRVRPGTEAAEVSDGFRLGLSPWLTIHDTDQA